jgi:hypothetical protein
LASCYRIPYRDRYGEHVGSKWGETPADAAALLRNALAGRGAGVAELGTPELIVPQPFAEAVPALNSQPSTLNCGGVPPSPHLTPARPHPAKAESSLFSLQ